MKRFNQNKISLTSILFIISCSLGFVCCSNSVDSVSNGTGSNAGDAEIFAFVQNEFGSPLKNASLRVWLADGDSLALDTALIADSNGCVLLDTSKSWSSSKVLLVANSGDSLSAMHWVTPKFGIDTLSVKTSVSVYGKLLNNNQALPTTRIKILDKEAVSDVDGSFHVPNLPIGVHWVSIFEEAKTDVMSVEASSNTSVNLFEVSTEKNILIEDFENWNLQTLLGKQWGGGWWYTGSDSALGGGSRVIPDFYGDLIVTDSSSYAGGKSLHANLSVDESFQEHFALVGFTLGDNISKDNLPSYYDLSGVTAVSFDIKGSGNVYLQFVYSEAGSATTTDDVQYENIALTLNPEWTHYSISTDNLYEAMSAVNAINFMAESDAEIFLDNIKLEGISLGLWVSLGL